MDLNQRKLNRSEWDSIEVPVSSDELSILNLIHQGYDNVNIRVNKGNSIFTFLKIKYNEKIEEYLFNKYLRTQVEDIERNIIKIDPSYKKTNIATLTRLNSADKIRLEKNSKIDENKAYEFILLKHAEKIVYYHSTKSKKNMVYHYYTLNKMITANVAYLNKFIIQLCQYIIDSFEEKVDIGLIVENASDIIESNKNLLKYNDLELYDHQKKIFTVCKNPNPKLILYMAPTGTGKTMTPIGLSHSNKIIFVCAARHVGLALARSAISVNKKVAFAFGCESADDIRLHYFSAKEFTKNKRSGGIGKVDNSVGDNVEIIICDLKSYLPAMYYMLAFNKKENIIMYWDEPTITMDYEEHEIHDIIKKNWSDNIIPNIVLSSATLPKYNELTNTIHNFIKKNEQSDGDGDGDDDHTKHPFVENIVSHDCKKSIPILNTAGFVVLPHYLTEDYEEVQQIARHCSENKTLLRYFDLKEVVEFVTYLNKEEYTSHRLTMRRYFDSVSSITMSSIKEYYLTLLENIQRGIWGAISVHFKSKRISRLRANDKIDTKGNKIKKLRSLDSTKNRKDVHDEEAQMKKIDNTAGVYITTKDAYTLTDGPTIYICENVQKIATFCIQQANIPSSIMTNIMTKIEFNNTINEKLNVVEKELEYKRELIEKSSDSNNSSSKGKGKSKKISRESNNTEGKSDIARLTNEINGLRNMIKSAVLNDTFIPNTHHHIEKWASDMDTGNAFSCNIEEHIVNEIMSLNGIEDSWKVLLMMGIGVFINHPNIAYTEIMKKLADEQKLFMIIATSDYIYGTNYQFCHAYLGKDLNLTQEKIIQAMGRVGRSNIQQTYTLRFRDNNQILKLFTNDTERPEVNNMNRLLL